MSKKTYSLLFQTLNSNFKENKTQTKTNIEDIDALTYRTSTQGKRKSRIAWQSPNQPRKAQTVLEELSSLPKQKPVL